ncbi:putative membrane protein [[Clostridium] sordellii ATCC 9714]|nr:putative membrane protein [[Clostridium] sordellii ATCC 9714] [Paeniclostridium sordellii ATCC 9714]
MQNLLHWVVICIIWLIVGIFLINLAKKKYGFDLLENKIKLKGLQYVGIVLCLIVSIASHYIDWGGFKPILEFQRLGVLKFIFQYIYYLFEVFLITLIVIFAQKAFEKWFKNETIPYGGIVLALTWGLMHIVSKGSITVGLLSAFGGFLYGSAYLVVGKDYRKALPLMYLMFVL